MQEPPMRAPTFAWQMPPASVQVRLTWPPPETYVHDSDDDVNETLPSESAWNEPSVDVEALLTEQPPVADAGAAENIRNGAVATASTPSVRAILDKGRPSQGPSDAARDLAGTGRTSASRRRRRTP